MKTEIRWQKIEDFLRKSGTLSTQEMASRLSVSEATIRRDLIEMENRNMIKRLWGGASLVEADTAETAQYQDGFILRFERNAETKQRIAKYAASLIQDGDCVFLDAGSTTSYVVQYITAQDVTIVTNSLNNFSALAKRRIRTYVPCGFVNFGAAAIMGQDTGKQLERMNFDIAFFGNGGLDEKAGYTTRDEHDATIKSSVLARCKSGKVYVLSDSTKFGSRRFYTFADINDVTLITDERPHFPIGKIILVD